MFHWLLTPLAQCAIAFDFAVHRVFNLMLHGVAAALYMEAPKIVLRPQKGVGAGRQQYSTEIQKKDI